MLKTLRTRSKGLLVLALKNMIFDSPSADFSPVFDVATELNVEQLQDRNGLHVDGIVGPDTWRMLAALMPTVSTRRNRSSKYTRALQILLGISADGIFGCSTKYAVAAFQAANGARSVDGIAGPETWGLLICGRPAATFVQPTDFKQGDRRWGKAVYSTCGNSHQTIANSGCGPTAAANIVNFLVDKNVTPVQLAELAIKRGHRTRNSGTAWSFFREVAKVYGFRKFVQTSSIETMKSCLETGGYAVCSMGRGYWTKGGHFITAWKHENGYIYCNDPASHRRTRQKERDFNREKKQFFCFWK